ncbi:hypothetical protein GEMRC1_001765 [Eukaryota sp. GEM-RC1]
MSICIETASAINSIYNNSIYSDQELVFDDETINVTKVILAASSTTFTSLWYLEFKDRLENPNDFSDLKVSSSSFVSFIKSFYGFPVSLTDDNAYDFFYLAHYFQAPLLIDQVEAILATNLQRWSWLRSFVTIADKNDDLRALEFAGPYFEKVKDIEISSGSNLKTESFGVIVKFCRDNQSQSWLIKSIVESIKNSSFDTEQFPTILYKMEVKLLSYAEWDSLLLVPLQEVKEVRTYLMEFLFDKLKFIFFDSLKIKNLRLEEENQLLNKTLMEKNN